MNNTIRIGNKIISKASPTFVIAEMSANHLQNFDLAKKIIKEAKKSGADAIKLQTYTPDTITIDCDNKFFRTTQGTLWEGMTLYELYEQAYTPWEWQPKLKEIADKEGIMLFSSPFDKQAVDFLEDMNVPAYKVASFEITDIPLIEYIASKGKPIIISTGIATLADIEKALNACKKMGNTEVALLKCTSAYPTPLDEVNLNTIPNIENTFRTVVGLSDHTLGSSVAIASVALGARIVEKHLTLNREMGGPDGAFSMEPIEFKEMVDGIRIVEKALGNVTYDLTDKMKKSRQNKRSLFIVNDIKKGEVLTDENVRSIRPGYGIHTEYLNKIKGKKVKRDVTKGTPLSWELIE